MPRGGDNEWRNRPRKMTTKRKREPDAADMKITFLGTCSGGGPTKSRNCSSLVLDMFADRDLWMVDCAEGTVRQFASHPDGAFSDFNFMKRVCKVFITHMHADHVMGLITLLRNLLYVPKHALYSGEERTKERVEIFGPAGLRNFVRMNMKATLTHCVEKYCVHELLTADEPVTPCEPIPVGSTSFHVTELGIMHSCELPGLDIRADPDGLWRAITEGRGRLSKILVDAGPILHRDPCIGYVFQEAVFPSRKIVILGDTYNPDAMIPLCVNPPPSLLIHEATDSHIEEDADLRGRYSKRSAEMVMENTLANGHSVAAMAGEFAKKVKADALVLNHIGARFPGPGDAQDHYMNRVMRDFQKKADVAWGHRKAHAKVAFDYMKAEIPVDKHRKRDDYPKRNEVSKTHERGDARNPPERHPKEIKTRDSHHHEHQSILVGTVCPVASTSQAIHTPAGGGSEFIEREHNGNGSNKRRRKR